MKRKGTAAERDLIHKFWKNDIAAIRVAGSGSMRHPSPDIIAGRHNRKIVIECKSLKGTTLYIPKKEIEDLKKFATLFGSLPYLAVKFDTWYFLILEDLYEKETSFSINTEQVKYRGLLFEDILKLF